MKNKITLKEKFKNIGDLKYLSVASCVQFKQKENAYGYFYIKDDRMHQSFLRKKDLWIFPY